MLFHFNPGFLIGACFFKMKILGNLPVFLPLPQNCCIYFKVQNPGEYNRSLFPSPKIRFWILGEGREGVKRAPSIYLVLAPNPPPEPISVYLLFKVLLHQDKSRHLNVTKFAVYGDYWEILGIAIGVDTANF